MSEQNLEKLVQEFLHAWISWVLGSERRTRGSFERTPIVRSLIADEWVANHLNPLVGEYAIHHKYTGIIFFTGTGEIAFPDTENGMLFANEVAQQYAKRRSGDIQVIKIMAEYH